MVFTVEEFVVLLPCNKKLLVSNAGLSFCVEFACSTCAVLDSIWVLQLPPSDLSLLLSPNP